MLKNIQIKIVLIFLIIGIVMIGAMGYVNYASLQSLSERVLTSSGDNALIIQEYQGQLKIITLLTILVFALICVLIRYFCDKTSHFTNN